jgi:hypothetical protein
LREAAAARHFGTIEVGMKVDLVPSAQNPLEHVESLQSPLGVMTEITETALLQMCR